MFTFTLLPFTLLRFPLVVTFFRSRLDVTHLRSALRWWLVGYGTFTVADYGYLVGYTLHLPRAPLHCGYAIPHVDCCALHVPIVVTVPLRLLLYVVDLHLDDYRVRGDCC